MLPKSDNRCVPQSPDASDIRQSPISLLPFPSPYFPVVRVSPQSGLESSNITILFESALLRKADGQAMEKHPLAKQLEQCYTLESSDVL